MVVRQALVAGVRQACCGDRCRVYRSPADVHQNTAGLRSLHLLDSPVALSFLHDVVCNIAISSAGTPTTVENR